jgi:hypothetical protein
VLYEVDPDGAALRKIPREELAGQPVLELLLDDPPEWLGPVDRVVPEPGDLVERGIAALERDARLRRLADEPPHLDVADPPDVLLVERVKDDRLVEPVQELGKEPGRERILHGVADLLLAAPLLRDLLERLAADAARHLHDRVGEVDRVAEAVGERAVFEHLEKHVEHVAVGLLGRGSSMRTPPPTCSPGRTVGFQSTRVSGSPSSTAMCRATLRVWNISCDTVRGRPSHSNDSP